MAKLLAGTVNGTVATSTTAAFAPVKQRFISEVDEGIIQRQENQALLPEGNAAVAGLGIVSYFSSSFFEAKWSYGILIVWLDSQWPAHGAYSFGLLDGR